MARIREERVRALREKFTLADRLFPRKFRGATVSLLFIACLTTVLLMLSSTRAVNAGTVEAIGVGIYWDNNCTNVVSTINWGALSPGETKSITFYVRNEETENAILDVKTDNWDPTNAVNFMTLGWNYSGNSIAPSKIVKIQLTLSISSDIEGITNFRFNIIIEAQSAGSTAIPGDANGDGKVNSLDLFILAKAWGSKVGDPNWDPRADFNEDNRVDVHDLFILSKNWNP